MLITVAVSTVVWLAVTFMTRPEPDAKLEAFYQRVRPAARLAPRLERLGLRPRDDPRRRAGVDQLDRRHRRGVREPVRHRQAHLRRARDRARAARDRRRSRSPGSPGRSARRTPASGRSGTWCRRPAIDRWNRPRPAVFMQYQLLGQRSVDELEPLAVTGYIGAMDGRAESARLTLEEPMSTTNQPEVADDRHPGRRDRGQEVHGAEGVDPASGGLRVSVQPGGCSGFKYGLLIEDQAAEDDLVVDQGGFSVFVDPFSAQYLERRHDRLRRRRCRAPASPSRTRTPPAAAAAAARSPPRAHSSHDTAGHWRRLRTSAPDTRPAIARRVAGLLVSAQHARRRASASARSSSTTTRTSPALVATRIATLIRERNAAGERDGARARDRLDADRRLPRADPHAPRGGAELRERRDVQSRRVLPDARRTASTPTTASCGRTCSRTSTSTPANVHIPRGDVAARARSTTTCAAYEDGDRARRRHRLPDPRHRQDGPHRLQRARLRRGEPHAARAPRRGHAARRRRRLLRRGERAARSDHDGRRDDPRGARDRDPRDRRAQGGDRPARGRRRDRRRGRRDVPAAPSEHDVLRRPRRGRRADAHRDAVAARRGGVDAAS